MIVASRGACPPPGAALRSYRGSSRLREASMPIWLATARKASFGALSVNGQASHSLRLHQPIEHVSTTVTIRGLHSLVTTNRLPLGVGGLFRLRFAVKPDSLGMFSTLSVRVEERPERVSGQAHGGRASCRSDGGLVLVASVRAPLLRSMSSRGSEDACEGAGQIKVQRIC